MYKLVLLPLLFAGCALAQTDLAVDKAITVRLRDPGQLASPNLAYFPVVRASSPVTRAPYSAQSTTQRIQMLADGNRIEQTTSASIARDSQGRVRNEAVLGGMALPAGNSLHVITIDDPVAGYTYELNSNNKTAFKLPAPKNRALEKGAYTLSTKQMQKIPGGLASPDQNVANADLGTQTMEGVLVQGTRLTRTIPAGSIGNEQPLVITTETWFSPDLKVLVMSKSTDPRIGETTYQLTNIQRSEPSPALFEIPSDYTVKDTPPLPNAIFIGKPGQPEE